MGTRWAALEATAAGALKLCPRCLREFTLAKAFCPFDGEALSQRPLGELTRGRPSSRASGLFVERYAVRGLLGKGAMTHVLLGEDLVTREPVAIKVLDMTFLGRPEVVERFTREAEALRRVDHPNVVRSWAAGQGADGLPFHVLEHLQGESLDLLLHRERVLHPKLALRLLWQCASALEAIHRVGVIHRDVKPANLMLLGEEGRPLGVKLVDFGFAHVNGSAVQTPPGTALGTVAYMAPEQILGDRVDGRSDIYGLGVLAYRMLSGSLPFEGEGLDLMARQLTEPVPSLASSPQPLEEGLVKVVARSTRKDPEQRYPTARHLKEDLQKLLGGGGPLLADTLPSGEDRFLPGPGLPRQAARFLYGRLGLTAPVWGD